MFGGLFVQHQCFFRFQLFELFALDLRDAFAGGGVVFGEGAVHALDGLAHFLPDEIVRAGGGAGAAYLFLADFFPGQRDSEQAGDGFLIRKIIGFIIHR